MPDLPTDLAIDARAVTPADGDLDVAPDVGAEPESGWDAGLSLSGRDHFRPDIEGLRAVAILAVLAFHAGVPFIPGGFVGVDVFFVISGFLITGLLLRDHQTHGRIDLASFYARRARRLLPAALVVIVVTIAASALLLSTLQFRTTAVDGAAAALYVSNYRFALTATDYFAADAPPSPLLHFWSLGVEEQFYLFWPLLMLVALRLVGARRIWVVIATIAVVSFAASIVVTGIEPAWAFYSLPTRAWQIALGSVIAALFATRTVRIPGMVGTWLGAAGLALIAVALVGIDSTTAYPGWWAVLPALGAAMLIVAGEHRTAVSSRALASPVPRWFGRISYSLYLWHWPLLIIIPAALALDGLPIRLVLAMVAIAIAALSTRFLENPFRFGRSLPKRPGGRTVAIAGALSLAIAALAIAASAAVGGPSGRVAVLPDLDPAPTGAPAPLELKVAGPLPADVVPSLLDADLDRGHLFEDGCQTTLPETVLHDCEYADTGSATTIVLFGDSHAGMWFPAVERIAEERHWRLLPLVKVGCTPVAVTVWENTLKRAFQECDDWREQALDRIASEQPSITMVVTSRSYQVADENGDPMNRNDQRDAWRAGFVAVLQQLQESSDRVILIGETPHIDRDPVECLASEGLLEMCTPTRAVAAPTPYQNLERASAAQAGVEFISTVDWLCDDAVCPLVIGDFLVYRNQGHLTATVTAALAPQLLWAMEQSP
jgi:peptidoglycan/LPS O-acetylase OafA/YrhL